jgi:bifunctional DNase/RNase
MRSVDLVGIQMEVHTGAPVLILREHDEPHRLLPIFVGGAEAASIALAANGQTLDRPLTHDLMANLVDSLDGHLDAVEVTELREGAFVANLAISGPAGDRRVDTRPSDAIALAIRLGAPLFVSDDVLDVAGALPSDTATEVTSTDAAPPDTELIDAEVERFREFLGEVDADDFATGDDDHDGGPAA